MHNIVEKKQTNSSQLPFGFISNWLMCLLKTDRSPAPMLLSIIKGHVSVMMRAAHPSLSPLIHFPSPWPGGRRLRPAGRPPVPIPPRRIPNNQFAGRDSIKGVQTMQFWLSDMQTRVGKDGGGNSSAPLMSASHKDEMRGGDVYPASPPRRRRGRREELKTM